MADSPPLIEPAAAGATLARAFFTDPIFSWAQPDDDARRAMGPWFTSVVQWGLRYGEVKHIGSASAPEAVAVWGQQGTTLFEQVRSGMAYRTFGLGLTALTRLLRVSLELGALHEKLCPEPHRYLYMLGVDTALQGKGLGSALIRPTLAQADREGRPCYLETATEVNVPFYLRHGYLPVHEGEVLKGAPKFWLLKRPPRPE